MSSKFVFEDKPSQNILVVEDEPADQILIEKNVKEFWRQANVVCVSSIKQAYNACKAQQFDLVVLDLNLPDGYGPSSINEIRRFNRDVPIIVVTGMLPDLTIEVSLKNGATHVVSKRQLIERGFQGFLS